MLKKRIDKFHVIIFIKILIIGFLIYQQFFIISLRNEMNSGMNEIRDRVSTVDTRITEVNKERIDSDTKILDVIADLEKTSATEGRISSIIAEKSLDLILTSFNCIFRSSIWLALVFSKSAITSSILVSESILSLFASVILVSTVETLSLISFMPEFISFLKEIIKNC